MNIDDFGKDYLMLGLRIGKIIDGYVDSYFGPHELQLKIEAEDSLSPKILLDHCLTLQKNLDNQGYGEKRTRFLEKLLQSMETSLRIQSGEKISYLDQVNRIYDITPELVSDSYFHQIAEKLEDLIKGSKPLAERIEDLNDRRAVPLKKARMFYNHAFEILKTRTNQIYPNLLPEGEEMSAEFVQNKPWSAYNWYLGNYKSRIDVNTDLPGNMFNILFFAGHEGYPGHHTEHSIKEKSLYREQERFEHSILLICTPQAVISEGLANVGLNMLYSIKEQVAIALENYCPDPSQEDSVDILTKQYDLRKNIYSKLLNNVAIHANVDGWSDKELINYSLGFGLLPKKVLLQQLKFVRAPLWSTYVFNYSYGKDLIARKYGERPSPENFKILLTQPVLPSNLI